MVIHAIYELKRFYGVGSNTDINSINRHICDAMEKGKLCCICDKEIKPDASFKAFATVNAEHDPFKLYHAAAHNACKLSDIREDFIYGSKEKNFIDISRYHFIFQDYITIEDMNNVVKYVNELTLRNVVKQ